MPSATRLGSKGFVRRHSLMPQPFKHPTTHVYYFRRKVPKRLVEALGYGEYKRSLGTKDLEEAKPLFLVEAARCEEAFARARAKLAGDDPITRRVADDLAATWFVAEQERLHLVGALPQEVGFVYWRSDPVPFTATELLRGLARRARAVWKLLLYPYGAGSRKPEAGSRRRSYDADSGQRESEGEDWKRLQPRPDRLRLTRTGWAGGSWDVSPGPAQLPALSGCRIGLFSVAVRLQSLGGYASNRCGW